MTWQPASEGRRAARMARQSESWQLLLRGRERGGGMRGTGRTGDGGQADLQGQWQWLRL